MANPSQFRFRDADFRCRKCRAKIGRQIADGQILLIGEIAVFNWLRGKCIKCEKPFDWQSPMLADDFLPDTLQDLPSIAETLLNFRQSGIGTKEF